MDPRELIQAIISGETDIAANAFSEAISDKVTDAIEVRKVEIASSIMGETVEKVDEVLDTGSTSSNKDLALHKQNLTKMQMDPLERTKIMAALKSHMAGKRLNVTQNTALTGYLERAGGLGNVSAAVRNKALKQQ